MMQMDPSFSRITRLANSQSFESGDGALRDRKHALLSHHTDEMQWLSRNSAVRSDVDGEDDDVYYDAAGNNNNVQANGGALNARLLCACELFTANGATRAEKTRESSLVSRQDCLRLCLLQQSISNLYEEYISSRIPQIPFRTIKSIKQLWFT